MANRRTYIDGNTVRKYDTVTVPKRQSEQHKQEEQLSPKTRKKIDRVLAFDLKYTMVLVAAVAFAFWACIAMISVQAQISAQSKEISALEEEYQSLVNDNDALNAKVNSDVDLDAIRQEAMEELGMVYPDAGQVITFESTKEQYVKQYQDVPDLD